MGKTHRNRALRGNTSNRFYRKICITPKDSLITTHLDRQVFDILPNLLDIIQPNLRPVNTQLYSAREKEELKALVDTMTAYNLTYVQERSQEGQYVYK